MSEQETPTPPPAGQPHSAQNPPPPGYYQPTPPGPTPQYDGQPGTQWPGGYAPGPQQPPYGQAPYGQAPYGMPQPGYNYPYYPPAKSKIAAALLSIFLGVFGVGNFYLGYTGRGLAQLLISVLTFGLFAPLVMIWSFIEGIYYLVADMPVDAKGIPLRS